MNANREAPSGTIRFFRPSICRWVRISRAFVPKGTPTYMASVSASVGCRLRVSSALLSISPGVTISVKRPLCRRQMAVFFAGRLCGRHVWHKPLCRNDRSSAEGMADNSSWVTSTWSRMRARCRGFVTPATAVRLVSSRPSS